MTATIMGKLEDYIERSTSLVEDSPQMGEENTKVKLVQPLIELLGWDVYSSDVELEYPMQIGRGNTRADYALQLEGAPVVFIEAKGCDSTLSESDKVQLTSYMRQKGVDWGLLTNGRRFEIYRRRNESNRPEEVSLAEFDLENLEENWSVMKLLSKDLVRSGEADTIAHRMEARKRAVRRLKSDKEDVAERVAKLVIDEVGDELAQEIESESKEFVDGLIDSLGTDRDAEVDIERSSPEPVEQGVDEQDVEEYRVRILDEGEEVHSFASSNQSDAMADPVDFLVREYGLVSELGPLPYVPGEKTAVLNSEPRHPSGEEMKLFRPISEGCFVYTSLNQGSKKRYIRRFAELCGLEVEFEGDW